MSEQFYFVDGTFAETKFFFEYFIEIFDRY